MLETATFGQNLNLNFFSSHSKTIETLKKLGIWWNISKQAFTNNEKDHWKQGSYLDK